MDSEQVTNYVLLVGLGTQVAGAGLVALLFALLQRQVRRERAFRAWTLGWTFLTIALVALVPYITGLARGGSGLLAASPLSAASVTVYQLAKLFFLFFLLLGTLVFAKGRSWRRQRRAGMALVTVYGLASVLTSRELAGALAWQAPVVIGVAATCCWLFLTLPRQRRSLGSRVAGTALALITVLWLANGLYLLQPSGGFQQSVVRWVATLASAYGPYGDMILQVLLGFGLVLLLFEGTVRQATSALEELSIRHRQLERDAFLDPLTGALNRAAFAAGHGTSLASAGFGVVMMFDLDDLKKVNDEAGHEAGDQLLRSAAEAIRAELRPSDTLFRWGGDEFLAVLPGARTEEVAARLAETLDSSPPEVVTDARMLQLRLSLGAEDFASGDDLERAIIVADQRMLDAKRLRKRRRTPTAPA